MRVPQKLDTSADVVGLRAACICSVGALDNLLQRIIIQSVGTHGTQGYARRYFDALARAGAEYMRKGVRQTSPDGTKLATDSFQALAKTSRRSLLIQMAFTKEEAVERARQDLASRVAVKQSEIKQEAVEDVDFPDMALGAGVEGEMSGQMITPGWRIRLRANGNSFEYRANKHQVRLLNFKGTNHKV